MKKIGLALAILGGVPIASIWSKNKFGQPPIDCTPDWVLYHKQSGFYYSRNFCIH